MNEKLAHASNEELQPNSCCILLSGPKSHNKCGTLEFESDISHLLLIIQYIYNCKVVLKFKSLTLHSHKFLFFFAQVTQSQFCCQPLGFIS